jgi:hypothetical protein
MNFEKKFGVEIHVGISAPHQSHVGIEAHAYVHDLVGEWGEREHSPAHEEYNHAY